MPMPMKLIQYLVTPILFFRMEHSSSEVQLLAPSDFNLYIDDFGGGLCMHECVVNLLLDKNIVANLG